MTVEQLASMLEPIDANSMASFLQRGQLLTARTEIESAITNLRKQQADAAAAFDAQIQVKQAELASLQQQIDALS